jgi:hypothetical protein
VRGHLPMRYQLVVWLVGLVTMTGTGAWLAWSTPVPLVWSSGAVVGALLGIAAVGAFVHAIGTESEDSPARR